MDAPAIISILQQALPGAACEPGAAGDQPTIYVPRETLVDTCRVLRDSPLLQFHFLAEVTASDWWPREPRFEVVYHLACLGLPIQYEQAAPARRLRLKVRVAGDDARLPTVSGIWPVANWPERELWDLFGIGFEDHPDLRRLLMPDDWDGHPLRKDYPVQIKMAVKSTQPLQLSEEEFVANIQAARWTGGRDRDAPRGSDDHEDPTKTT
jgi:NADH-quinone oxidoreductase subunit C